jgi:hypothetical protein
MQEGKTLASYQKSEKSQRSWFIGTMIAKRVTANQEAEEESQERNRHVEGQICEEEHNPRLEDTLGVTA